MNTFNFVHGSVIWLSQPISVDYPPVPAIASDLWHVLTDLFLQIYICNVNFLEVGQKHSTVVYVFTVNKCNLICFFSFFHGATCMRPFQIGVFGFIPYIS